MQLIRRSLWTVLTMLPLLLFANPALAGGLKIYINSGYYGGHGGYYHGYRSRPGFALSYGTGSHYYGGRSYYFKPYSHYGKHDYYGKHGYSRSYGHSYHAPKYHHSYRHGYRDGYRDGSRDHYGHKHRHCVGHRC